MPSNEQPPIENLDTPDNPDEPNNPTAGKTLIVYYSFTNNVHTIVSDLLSQIEADVVRVEPTEEGVVVPPLGPGRSPTDEFKSVKPSAIYFDSPLLIE